MRSSVKLLLRSSLLFLTVSLYAGNKISEPQPPRKVESGILFSFYSPDAFKVYLAGDFNNWGDNVGGKVSDPAFEMKKNQDGTWTKIVPIESGIFKYKFVAADEKGQCSWFADPAVLERDGDGNSVFGLAQSASGEKIIPVAETPFSPILKVKFYFVSSIITFQIFDAKGQLIQQIAVPPIVLDGETQKDFRQDKSGKFLENKSLKIEFQAMSQKAVAVTWTCKDRQVHPFELRIPDNSSYYGGGEHFQAINQKGYILSMASIDHPEDKGSVSYKPVPFYMSSRGYGIWINSYSPGTFDFNAADRYHCIIRYPENQLKMIFFAGPRMNEILNEYTALSGRPPVPPAWAFAPWKSRDVHRNREDVLQDVEWNRKYHLPASVLVLDSPWETGYNNFVLNQTQLQNPRALFDRVEELGFYPCLWLTPFVNSRNIIDMKGIEKGASSNFKEAAERGYLVKLKNGKPMIMEWWKGEGGLVDFTNPKAVEWWHSQIAKTKEWGAHVFKCDDGEGNFVGDAVFYDGSSPQKMKNRYAELYLKTMHEYIQKNLNGDGVLFARPGFSGTQKYPFCWSGDNVADFSFSNGFPTAILAGQTAALSGISMWGHDIAGYQGRPTKELFIRWSQFGAFSPLMQIHMTSNLGPWDFDEETIEIYRKFAKLHTDLFPYIYQAAHEANESGMPIIRPMALAFQNDSDAGKNIYQYMFGPDLLVAPMFQGGSRRTLYLPSGEWIDYWNGKHYAGKQTLEMDVPLDKVPLFVRAGAMIPMIPKDVDTLIPRHPKMAADVVAIDDRRIVQAWDGQGTFSTWESMAGSSDIGAEHGSVTLSSKDARPLEARLMFHDIKKIDAKGTAPDSYRYDSDENATVCRWKSFKGEVTLTW